jgi:hypothetical protein
MYRPSVRVQLVDLVYTILKSPELKTSPLVDTQVPKLYSVVLMGSNHRLTNINNIS